MKISTNYLGLAVVLAACTTNRSDVCDGATSGEACRWAGTGAQGFNRVNPSSDRLDSLLNSPTDVTFGPDGRAYIDDWNNHMVRRVEHDQSLRVVVGTLAEADGQKPDDLDHAGPDPAHPYCNPPGAIGTDVALNHPVQSVFGPDGLLYIAAWHNNKVRTLDPATGMVKTIAGDFYNTGGPGGDGGPACEALFNQPSSLAIASDGTVYLADQRDVRIRTLAPTADRLVAPLAGVQGTRCVLSEGTGCSLGDGGPMNAALFGWDTTNTPQVSGALLLVGRTMYVSDSGNHRIRRIDLDTGMIDCIAGSSAQAGYSGDGGLAVDAKLNWPLGLALGPDGRLYVADRDNHAVRAIDLTTNTIDTVVGDGTICDTTQEVCPDVAPALQMELNQPYGVKFDPEGSLYVADTLNNRILKVIR